MRHFLLDTSALLALRDDEPGAERVASVLRDTNVQCHACFMTRMEVLYRVWKDENELLKFGNSAGTRKSTQQPISCSMGR